MSVHGEPATDDTLRLLHSELYHAVWLLILGDKRLREAFTDGIKLLCGDGVLRRILFAWAWNAMDYPEK